ncbi:MAG: RIO1 family regulatory kinase/ATPase [Desulfobacterales bacterium]
MTKKIAGIPEQTLLAWVTASLRHGQNVLGRGYQCHTLLYRDCERSLVVKAPLGRGLAASVRRRMLKNEYAVYGRLAGLPGIPRCHGFLENRYLVLDFVDGVPIQGARIHDRDHFFETLLHYIEKMHRAGVAHGDLKKKDNILVVDGRQPILLDFGVAVIRKPARRLVNRSLFRLFAAFDFNAYVKLKYGKRTDLISAADRRFYRRTVVEKSSGWIKRRYLQAKKILPTPANQ